MKIKIIFKKMMVMIVAVTLITLGASVKAVEAAEVKKCGLHEEYYNAVINGRNVGYLHYVEREVYVQDEDGSYVNLSELTGETYWITCTVSFEDLCVAVRCKKCHYQVGTYWYTTKERHSYCEDE